MALHQTIIQERFEFRGANALRAWCRLRAWEARERAAVVIAADVADNPGPCVTNSIEVIAELAWQLLERPVGGLVLIQQYTGDTYEIHDHKEEFAVVTFKGPGRFDSPEWLPVQRAVVEAMLDGAPL